MNRSIRKSRGSAFVLLAIVFFATWGVSSNAQTFRGAILGTVTDSSGSAVGGATVQVKNTGTGLTRTVTTSDDGSYSVPELPIGTYTISVEKTGFKTGIVSGIQVEVGSERRADVSLQPGEISQRVEVTGDVLPLVESTSNVLGGIIESKIVNTLPVNGRDYQKLILLAPGASSSPDQITDSPGSFGTFSVNGARGRANNYLLDGTDMNDGYRNDPAINEAGVFGTPATILPVDAIAEMNIQSNFEAEYGRSAGAVINIVTKSGANDWHGSAIEFFRNTDLNARNYFNTVDQPQQPFHNNQFGGSLGGPIKRDKTFFFLNYEGMRESGKEASPACVPTAADFAANAPAIPNTVIQNLLALNPWPAPTDPNTDCYVDGGTNAALATPFSNRVDSAIVKIDHHLNSNNFLTGRYYIGDSFQSFPLALVGGGLLPNYNTLTPTRVQLVSLSYVSTISPSIVNETRLGWNRFAEGFFPQDRNFDPSSIGLVTIPNLPKQDFGLPVINVGSDSGSSLAQLGADKGDPRDRVDTNWHYVDAVSWKFGPNDIKFGYEYRRTSVSQIFDRRFRGVLDFDSLATFLEGVPNDSSVMFAGNTNRNTVQNSHSLYIQDSSRITRRFTLNLGLRYDYYGIVAEKHGFFTDIDPTTGFAYRPPGHLYAPDYNNWSPRVSFAWDLTGKSKTILRAGYGIFYDSLSHDLLMGHLPFGSSFAPGPAYGAFDGLNQLFTFGGTIQPGQRIFFPTNGLQDGFGIDPNIRTPYMQNYNLNLQQELGKHAVFQVGYVGSNGHKLYRFRDINQPSQAAINQADLACNGGEGCITTSRVFNDFNSLFYIYWQESSGNSSYNSLQSSLRINDWHGLTSTLNYTWSHSIDDSSDGEDFVPNAAQPNDSTFQFTNRGNSNFDVRHRFTWNFIYQFPNRHGGYERLTNGWGVNGIVTVQSGQPFHVILSDDYDGSAQFFTKPDVVGPIVYHKHDPGNYLDLTAFAVPCTPTPAPVNPGDPAQFDGSAGTCVPGTRHFGSLGRNALIGPNFKQFDFSIFKETKITERLKLELRFEAYNLFNHPNFANPILPNFLALGDGNGVSHADLPGNPNPCPGTAFGRTCGALSIGVTGDVGTGYPFLGGGGPRNLQLAAKFTF
jgi:carboxypeptidase family protein/TonB-dependent receptor-like protein